MSGSGRETLLDVLEWWEALPDIRVWSKGYPECPEMVGRPFRMSANGQEAILDVRKLSGRPPESPGDPTGCT